MNLTVKLGGARKTIKWPDVPAKPTATVTFGGQKPKK